MISGPRAHNVRKACDCVPRHSRTKKPCIRDPRNLVWPRPLVNVLVTFQFVAFTLGLVFDVLLLELGSCALVLQNCQSGTSDVLLERRSCHPPRWWDKAGNALWEASRANGCDNSCMPIPLLGRPMSGSEGVTNGPRQAMSMAIGFLARLPLCTGSARGERERFYAKSNKDTCDTIRCIK